MVMAEEERIGQLITGMYDIVSGPAGPRPWGRLREIFRPDGRFMRTMFDEADQPYLSIMSVDEYVESTSPFFDEVDFHEVEVSQRVDVFENMAQVWSVYEIRVETERPAPERRGINSIQLSRDSSGTWRIASMIWDNNRPPGLSPEKTISGFMRARDGSTG